MIIFVKNKHTGKNYPCGIHVADPVPPDGVWVVYALKDPRNNQTFYVGKTKEFLKRMRRHCIVDDSPVEQSLRKIAIYRDRELVEAEVLSMIRDAELAAFLEATHISGMHAAPGLVNIVGYDVKVDIVSLARARAEDLSYVDWRPYESMWNVPCNLASKDAPLSVVALAAGRGV